MCPHQLGCEAGPGVPVISQGGAAAGLQAHQAALHLPAHLQSERRTVVTWPTLRQSQLTSTPSLPSSKVVQESKLTETFLYICWVTVASINGCPGWATNKNNVMKLNICIFRTKVKHEHWALHAVLCWLLQVYRILKTYKHDRYIINSWHTVTQIVMCYKVILLPNTLVIQTEGQRTIQHFKLMAIRQKLVFKLITNEWGRNVMSHKM